MIMQIKDYQADNFAISAEAMDYFSELVNENLPDEIGSIVSLWKLTLLN